MPTPGQISALNDGRIDFGFLRLPVNTSGLHIESILEEPFVVVLPASHPFAAQQAITVHSLQNEPMLFLDRSAAPGYSDAVLGALSAEGLVLNIVQEFAELSTMVGLVASHLGLAIVPSSVAISLPPEAIARPLQPMSHRSQLGLAWKGKLSKVGKSFRDFCHEGAKIFSASTTLAGYLFRETSFPHGVFLMTGTGIVPGDDFTLASGDSIQIEIDTVGTLENRVLRESSGNLGWWRR